MSGLYDITKSAVGDGATDDTAVVQANVDAVKAWPNDHAPIQNVPLTSSDERMHVLDETCWCSPNVLAEGQGDDFRILEIDHQPGGGPSTSIRWERGTTGATTVRNAAGATILAERPHATDGTPCWCAPTVESFGDDTVELQPVRLSGALPSDRRTVTVGDTVTYHDRHGDRPLEVLRFNGLGRADLADDDGSTLVAVREGTETGRWSR